MNKIEAIANAKTAINLLGNYLTDDHSVEFEIWYAMKELFENLIYEMEGT